jgi:hypothetical protein
MLIMLIEELTPKPSPDGLVDVRTVEVADASEVEVGTEALRHCPQCNGTVFHRATVLGQVFAAQGPRTVMVWCCEQHPLPPSGGLVLR